MPAIGSANVKLLWSEGGGERTAVYRVHNVTTADTLDLSASFRKIKAAVWVPAGAPTQGVVGALSGTPATVVTLTLTGLANDTVYLLVIGEALP